MLMSAYHTSRLIGIVYISDLMLILGEGRAMLVMMLVMIVQIVHEMHIFKDVFYMFYRDLNVKLVILCEVFTSASLLASQVLLS
jgi:CBS domain-containing protein